MFALEVINHINRPTRDEETATKLGISLLPSQAKMNDMNILRRFHSVPAQCIESLRTKTRNRLEALKTRRARARR